MVIHYIDASVAVKWFKAGEEHSKEALALFKRIKEFEIDAVMSEWIVLEIVRALVKVGYSKDKIETVFGVIRDIFDLGIVRKIGVSEIVDLAKDIEIETTMGAADSVHLASAIKSGAKVLWSEDGHLHRQKVKEFAKKYEIEIRKIKEIGEF
jgi:predicted nucleic acid-binding protein